MGKSFHLQAQSGSHEVSYSARVYLIDLQKGMGQDKSTNTWTRVCFPEKKSSYVSSASLRDGRELPPGSHLRQQTPKKGRRHEKSYPCNDKEHPFPVVRSAHMQL